ncbi:CPBP family intramembrane glutamic endopeptidase [Patulibacter minatonensis]|uniref:CPBP family intramembrane glutamic endopeptidase n=1 Tax=Patulibacter minatonensis TaxID=298163 RepID=UPI00047A3F40|nr:CPBP family intramembrane glutamic endopeptidase [Patulibacter minatonensis]
MKPPESTTPSSPSSAEQGAPAATDGAAVPPKYWGWQGAALAFVAAFGALIFVSIPAVAIGDDTPGATAAGSVVSSILTCVVFVGMPVLILSMLVGGLRRRDVGLVLPSRKLWKIPLYAAIAFVVYLLLSNGLRELLDAGDQEDDLPKKLGAEGSAAAGIVIGIAVTVFAPIGEEFLLRGIVYPGLRDSLSGVTSKWTAIGIAAVLDGILFGALHIGGSKLVFVPILAVFGMALCLLYQATGSLYANILVHATNNTFAIGIALDWSFLGGLALWAFAVTCITLIALAARALELRLPPPRPRPGAVAAHR